MASKNGSCLNAEERTKLLTELQNMGELDSKDVPGSLRMELEQITKKTADTTATVTGDSSGSAAAETGNPKEEGLLEPFGTGCLSCGEDDDHANLLLCEGCNAEYHTYVG